MPQALSLKNALVNKKMLTCIFNGFTSGMPIYFLAQLIPAWLRSEDVDLKTIGFFGFVLIPYSFKFLWAPFLDRYIPPFLGRRRGWMLIAQIAVFISMLFLIFLQPQVDIDLILYCGIAIAFFSATQDIVLDAYRRELLEDNELGIGNAFYANAYRVSGFIPGGLGLILADYMPWPWVFVIIACFMFIGIIHALIISEVVSSEAAPQTLADAIIKPFLEFFQRDGFKQGMLIIGFIFFYKFGDTVATSLITPFYLDVGFTKTQLGLVAKTVSFWSMVIGGFLGGIIMIKLGINRALWFFGVVQLTSILGFGVLNEVGPNIIVLGVVVGFEYLGVGLGSAALLAFIASHTNKSFTGTQLALLTSVFSIPKFFAGMFSGIIIEGVTVEDGWFYSVLGNVDGMGYTNFFIICTGLALPGMLLLLWVAPWNETKTKPLK